jgi:shikimate kinase
MDLCADRAGAGRPLLAGDAAGKLAALAKTREPLYARISDAQIEVAGLSPEQVARGCAAAVRSLEAERAWS